MEIKNTLPIFVGIDPGLTGGIAFIDPNDREVALFKIPLIKDKGHKSTISLSRLRTILTSPPKYYTIAHISTFYYIERVHAMPGQGVTSMFRFGEVFGILEGIVSGLGFSPFFVSPQEWKGFFNLLGQDKNESIKKASIYLDSFKAKEENKKLLKKKTNHGIAEAFLIAYYALQQYTGRIEEED
jgi:crossover junction endodeoxyribonuclease RuvC